MTQETLGQRIKRLRLERNWSLRALAERAGLSHQAVSNIEVGGIVSLGTDTLLSIARAFKVPASYLLGEAVGEGLAFGLDVERAQRMIGLMEGISMSDPEQFLEHLSQLPEAEQELVKDIVDMMVIRNRYPRHKGQKSRTLGLPDHPMERKRPRSRKEE